MVLIGGAVVLALLALLARLPTARWPSWVRVYVGVAIAAVIVVVLVALLA
jgi:hypothetical protein